MRKNPAVATIVALLLAVSAPFASAQAPSGALSDSAPAIGSLEALAAMKALLRVMVTMQERYWYEHGAYAGDVAALGLAGVKRGEPVARIVTAGAFGWAARTEHPSLDGKSCVIYVGNGDQGLDGAGPATAAQKLRPTAEGVPACDEPEQITKAGRPRSARLD